MFSFVYLYTITHSPSPNWPSACASIFAYQVPFILVNGETAEYHSHLGPPGSTFGRLLNRFRCQFGVKLRSFWCVKIRNQFWNGFVFLLVYFLCFFVLTHVDSVGVEVRELIFICLKKIYRRSRRV